MRIHALLRVSKLIVFFLLIGSSIGFSQERRPKIGLVLSGGGAKGFAHVGVLKVIEEVGIPIDYIAGTSIGSIVGGLYSLGYSADSLEKIIRTADWEYLLSNDSKPEYVSQLDKTEQARYNISFPIESKRIALSTGLLNGQHVIDLLSYLTYGYHDVSDFSKLPIPFLCIATDLSTGKEVVLNRGSLPMAIRASMAVPAAFSASEIDGKLLVDGGLVNNYPVDRCLEMGADIIIGVDIMDTLRAKESIKGIPDVMSQLISLMSTQRSDKNAEKVDVPIRPNLDGYSASSFSNTAADSLILRGELAARKVYAQLVKLRDSLHLKPNNIPPRAIPDEKEDISISRIEVEGTQRSTITFFLGQVGLQRGDSITLGQIRQSISRLYATGNYEYVNYHIRGESQKTLYLTVKERSNNRLNAGLHYDSDLRSALLFNATLRGHNFYGSRLSVDAKLSALPVFAVRYSLDRGWKPGIFAGMMFAQDRFYRYNGSSRDAEINIKLNQFQLYTQSFLSKSSRLSLGGSVEHFALGSVIGNFPKKDVPEKTFVNVSARFEHNTLNHIYFPTHGITMGASVKAVLNNKLTDGLNHPYLIVNYSVQRAFSLSKRVTLLPSFYSRMVMGEGESFFHKTFLGGVQQIDYLDVQVPFYGLRRMEIITASVGTLSLETRINVWNKVYLSLVGQAAAYSDDNTFVTNSSWIYGTGLRLSFLNNMVGPFELMGSISSYNKTFSPFLSIGYWF